MSTLGVFGGHAKSVPSGDIIGIDLSPSHAVHVPRASTGSALPYTEIRYLTFGFGSFETNQNIPKLVICLKLGISLNAVEHTMINIFNIH